MPMFKPTYRATRRRQRSSSALRLCQPATALQAIEDMAAGEQDAAIERNQAQRDWIEAHEPERLVAVVAQQQQFSEASLEQADAERQLPIYSDYLTVLGDVGDVYDALIRGCEDCKNVDVSGDEDSEDSEDESDDESEEVSEEEIEARIRAQQAGTDGERVARIIADLQGKLAGARRVSKKRHYEEMLRLFKAPVRPEPLPAPKPTRPKRPLLDNGLPAVLPSWLTEFYGDEDVQEEEESMYYLPSGLLDEEPLEDAAVVEELSPESSIEGSPSLLDQYVNCVACGGYHIWWHHMSVEEALRERRRRIGD